MQALEDALYDYLAGDTPLLDLLEGPAADRIFATRPAVEETFPCVTFDSVAAPAFSQANPIADTSVDIDVAARTRPQMNAIAARIVEQLDIVQQRRVDQRPFVIAGRRILFQGFVDREGQNSYEATPRDVFHKVLSFRVITTTE
jgi:hypothetical protein